MMAQLGSRNSGIFAAPDESAMSRKILKRPDVRVTSISHASEQSAPGSPKWQDPSAQKWGGCFLHATSKP